MVLLFELPICREALGKKFGFAMWSLGRAAAVRRQFRSGIAEVRPGDGRGVAYGPLGVDLGLGWWRKGGRQGCSAAWPCGARLERLHRREGRLGEGYGRRG
jgi:hypothetical protein